MTINIFLIALSLYPLSFFANTPFKELEVVFTVSSCVGNPVLTYSHRLSFATFVYRRYQNLKVLKKI